MIRGCSRGVPSVVVMAALLLMAYAVAAQAQAPNAGLLLKQQQENARKAKETEPVQPPQPEIEKPSLPVHLKKLPNGEATLEVKGFRIGDDAGGLLPQKNLAELLDGLKGQSLSLDQLQNAADGIARFYIEHGYPLSHAYLPEQEIKNGVVAIRVMVGRLDNGKQGERIAVTGKDLRLAPARVQQTLASAVPSGRPLRLAQLERGVLLLDELPGITAKANMEPGSETGTSVLKVQAAEGPLFGANVGVDNYGYPATGYNRGGVALFLNDPMHIGDQASLTGNSTGSNMNYGRLFYQAPLGYRGIKLGGAVSYLQYKLGNGFSDLNGSGNAKTVSLFSNWAVIRSRQQSFSLGFALDRQALYNAAGGATTSDKHTFGGTLSVNEDIWDDFGGGGTTSITGSFKYAKLSLNGWPPDLQADSFTTRTQGAYSVLLASLGRQQHLYQGFSAYAVVLLQSASKNLDSSEKFVAGGATAVRAYPAGEGSADQGALFSAELRWDTDALPLPNSNLRVFAFFDDAAVQLHKNTWSGWQAGDSNAKNSYSIRGAGLGLQLVLGGRFALRAVYAHKIGVNPSPTVAGADNDGTRNNERFWLNGSYSF